MSNIKNRMSKQITQFKLVDELEARKNVLSILENQKEQIKKALPNNISPDRIIRIIMTAVSKEPKLLQSTPVSILGCAIQSAQLGLVPDSILGQCYFVPFMNTKKNTYEAQFIIGYRGYNDLIYRSGMVRSIFANYVLEGDVFQFEYGNNQTLKHIPKMRNQAKITFDDILYSYAYIYTINGGFIFKVLDKSELTIIRSYSKTREEISVWNSRPTIMAMKSAIRQIVKYAPLSSELRMADMLESMYESDEGQKWEEIVDVELQEKISDANVENGNLEVKNENVNEANVNEKKDNVQNGNNTNETQGIFE